MKLAVLIVTGTLELTGAFVETGFLSVVVIVCFEVGTEYVEFCGCEAWNKVEVVVFPVGIVTMPAFDLEDVVESIGSLPSLGSLVLAGLAGSPPLVTFVVPVVVYVT